jgi:hypothetical protein
LVDKAEIVERDPERDSGAMTPRYFEVSKGDPRFLAIHGSATPLAIHRAPPASDISKNDVYMLEVTP